MKDITITLTSQDLAHLQDIMDAALRQRGMAAMGPVGAIAALVQQAASAGRGDPSMATSPRPAG